MIEIEVCVDSVDSAIKAEQAGASRLEISSCLEVGGITPSIGLVKQIVKNVNLKVMVLIRCRSGDFTYSESEKQTMLESMRSFSKLDIKGFVIGALTQNGQVDMKFMENVAKEFGMYDLTFHRAFDYVIDLRAGIEQIKKLNFQRILTSGQSNDIIKGIKTIRNLVDLAGDSIIIMPGGGITPDNVGELVDKTNVKEIHASAGGFISVDIDYFDKDLGMGSMSERKVFSSDRFKQIKRNIQGV